MRRSSQVVALSAARLFGPLMALFALSLFVARAPGAGVGLLAGLTFALALLLHALVFGAAAARTAAPPAAARVLLSLGLIAAASGACAPAWSGADVAIEGGLFVATAGACALIQSALMGRAPSLRDEGW